MALEVVAARARASTPPELVWDVIARARDYPSWAGTEQAELEREGSPDPDGVGAIRRMRSTRRGRTVVVREEITAFEPGRAFAYRMLSGLPVRDYEARAEVQAAGDGSELHWRAQFRPRFPGTGWLLRRVLESVISEITERAAREAEGRARS